MTARSLTSASNPGKQSPGVYDNGKEQRPVSDRKRWSCHTVYTTPAPHGTVRITIARGGLEGGDNGIGVDYDTRHKGVKWTVHATRIDCGQWRTWKGLYYWRRADGSSWRAEPDGWRVWLADREKEMQAAYFAVIDAGVVAEARAYALGVLLPHLADKITQEREHVNRLVLKYDRWAAEAHTVSYAGLQATERNTT